MEHLDLISREKLLKEMQKLLENRKIIEWNLCERLVDKVRAEPTALPLPQGMMKIVYIAGKITGLDRERAKHHFDAAERYLRDEGFVALNPMILPEGLTYEQYIKIDIEMLKVAGCIYMLNNWMESRGAVVEHAIAQAMGMETMYE